jgi:S-adenosylmethionine-dependent methyltransferase
VLWEDLLSELPALAAGELTVLDAGGGAGHFALALARLGHHVVLADASREMLDWADAAIRLAGLSERVRIAHAPVQDLREGAVGRFDLVTCHALLEWLAEPEAALAGLAPLVKPDGHLSLMFYNRNARLLKRALEGRLDEVLRDWQEGPAPSGWGAGAIPMAEESVRSWLTSLGLRVRSKAGIRIFHDHVPPVARDEEHIESLLQLELDLRRQEPFASLGQHVHLVCEWAR